MPTLSQTWAICDACGAAFVYAATPVPVAVFLALAPGVRCPTCGERMRLLTADHKPTRVRTLLEGEAD